MFGSGPTTSAEPLPSAAGSVTAMRAMTYDTTDGSWRLVERPIPSPGPGEVRVAVRISGVNPTDWKARLSRGFAAAGVTQQVPNQDGAGVIDAVGPGVDPSRIGERVWLWEAAWQRPNGTAQEYVVIPSRQAVALPDSAAFELGASLGIPFLTAHRCLTVGEGGPLHLGPGALTGRTVLVTGGAGAVGNAAIQLARWAGAHVVTTVSSPEKARLATIAGAQNSVNYRHDDAAERLGEAAPDGFDLVVDVAVGTNLPAIWDALAPGASIASYATDDVHDLTVPIREAMFRNVRLQFVLVYTVPRLAKDRGVSDIVAALAEGAIRAGADAGLPFHRFNLDQTAEAHDAVHSGVVGKVLIDVS